MLASYALIEKNKKKTKENHLILVAYKTVGLSDYRVVGLSNYRTIECWTIEMSEYGAVELAIESPFGSCLLASEHTGSHSPKPGFG